MLERDLEMFGTSEMTAGEMAQNLRFQHKWNPDYFAIPEKKTRQLKQKEGGKSKNQSEKNQLRPPGTRKPETPAPVHQS